MAILGYNTIGASAFAVGVNYPICKFTASASGTITKLSAYLIKNFGGTTGARIAIYSDSSGSVNALLASSSSDTTISGTAGWYDFNISFAITNGVTYWFAVWATDVATVDFYYDGGGTNQLAVTTNATTPYTWETPVSSPSYFNFVMSIYATYTPANTTQDRTITGISRITATTDRTIAGTSRIQVTTDRTITGVSRIQATVDQTIAGISRIQKSVDQTITGISRITATTDQTITGLSRIQTLTDSNILGTARIQTSSDQTILGTARIQVTTTQNILGTARIRVATEQLISGISRIQKSVDQTIAGVSRIQTTVGQNISGIARIASIPYYGTLKVWNGVAWVDANLKFYNQDGFISGDLHISIDGGNTWLLINASGS